jgi:hypothetical protein
MKILQKIIVSTIFACAVVQAGELKRMEFPLDGEWHVANTSKVAAWPVMVAMKLDEQYQQSSAILVLSCEKAEGIQVYINWSDGRILDKNRWVNYEIDKEAPVRGIWDLSADGYATFFPKFSPTVVAASGLQYPSDFADKLAGSEVLVASVIIGRERPKAARFKLAGIQQALQKVHAGCELERQPR